MHIKLFFLYSYTCLVSSIDLYNKIYEMDVGSSNKSNLKILPITQLAQHKDKLPRAKQQTNQIYVNYENSREELLEIGRSNQLKVCYVLCIPHMW